MSARLLGIARRARIDLVGWRLEGACSFAITVASQRAVLYALVDKARDDGTSIYPSIATICAETGLKERLVQYTLKLFRQVGLLAAGDLRGGRGRATCYDLNVELLEALTLLREDDHGQRSFRLLAPVPDQKGAVKGAVADSERVQPQPERVQYPTQRVQLAAPDPLEPLEPLAQQGGAALSPNSNLEVAARIHREAAEAVGLDPGRAAHEFATVLAWVDAGLGDRVVPVIRKVLKRRRGQLPTSWSYFTPAIEESGPAPSPAPAISPPRDAPPDWEVHLVGFKRSVEAARRKGLIGIPYHAWHWELGPKPGESGCRVPLEILRRHGFAA